MWLASVPPASMYMNPTLPKTCPRCGNEISGWHKHLLNKDHARALQPFDDSSIDKGAWGPFACTACGARLVLICTDHKLVYKIAGAVFVGFIAGFILPAFIGLATCFSCGLFFAGLLIALFASLIIARSITVEVVKTAPTVINDPRRLDAG